MEVVLIGSGGCMRELAWQMMEYDIVQEKWDIVGYIDINRPIDGHGVSVGGRCIPYLGDDSYFEKLREPVNVVASIGSSKERKRIVKKLKKNPLVKFPNVVLSNVHISEDSNFFKYAEGGIISMDCRISTNVRMGDFVFMNIGSMICHDGIIGEFVTLGPDVKLAGNVKVGKNTDIGIAAKVIQGVHIGEDVIIGAGSVVIKNVESGCRVAGVPGKEIGIK